MDQRIAFFPVEDMDEAMRAELERCAQIGTPRPESSAIRAHVPGAFWGFTQAWDAVFRNGVADHSLKELCRVYVSRSVKCEYCGNQRSTAATSAGLEEGKYDELLNFESSAVYSEREKAALAYGEAITWRLDTDDAFWQRMYSQFTEPELVEIGFFIALTMGQQSWLRTLNIEHHQVLPGTAASMAPGFEDTRAATASKSKETYWAKNS